PRHLRHLLRTTPTIAPVPHRSLLYVSGSQCSEFLNGILATSVPKPARGPFFTTILHPQGRVLHDAIVYTKKDAKAQDGYIIEFDSRESEAPPLLQALKRFVLRSKVKIQDVSNDFDVWSIWGSEKEKSWDGTRQWNWARSGVVEPVWSEDEPWPWGSEELSIRDRRAVGMGRRVLVRKGDKPSESSTHETADHDTYTLHRMIHGVPEGIFDIPPMHATPMESNLDVMGGLDFRKGCYVGQELTVRTYHLGVLRKRIFPISVGDYSNASTSKGMPSSQSDIKPFYVEDLPPAERPRLRGTGKLLDTIQGVGLALLRLEHVDAVDKGILKFQIRSEDIGGRTWDIRHWWPDWWP
ncbi:Aminomethyltransferase folate-binding domain-containing protein, partial [Schizopora paradoxa]